MLTVSIPAWAQSEHIIDNYTVKDGLGGEFASTMTQDKHGFIWIHNGNSLSRFDGYSFRVYRSDKTDSSTFRSIVDGSLSSDPDGNIWISNYTALDNKRLILYQHNDSTDGFNRHIPDLQQTNPHQIKFDKKEPIAWIGTASGGGLFSYHIKRKETKKYLQAHPEKEIQSQINTVRTVKDYDSFLLLGTSKGLWKFDKQTKTFSRPTCGPTDTAMLYSSVIVRMIDRPDPDTLNDVWFEVNKVLIQLDSNLSIIRRVPLPENIGLVRKRDHTGEFWFMGSGYGNPGSGVHTFNPETNSVSRVTGFSLANKDFQNATLNSIFIDRDNNTWISSWDRGVFRISRPDLKFYNTPVGALIGSCNLITVNSKECLVITHENVKVKGSPVQILMSPLDNPTALSFKIVKTDAPLDGRVNNTWRGKNTFWMGTWGSGVIGLPINLATGMIEAGPVITIKRNPNNPNTLSGNNTSGVWEDQDENLWVGTYGAGLNKIIINKEYGTEGSVIQYRNSKADSNSLASNVIWWEYHQEDKESFWVITSEGADLFYRGAFQHLFKNSNTLGIYKTNEDSMLVVALPGLYEGIKKGSGYVFTENKQFHNKDLVGVSQDHLGRVWISTLTGVILFDRKKQLVVEFTERDGARYTRDVMLRTAEGQMILFDQEGITIFDPSTFKINEGKTRTQFTNLSINNTPLKGNRFPGDATFLLPASIELLQELTLDYQHNNFSLTFSALEMNAPEKNLYQHQLENYDQDWIETDHRNRTATYTNLPAGEYTFRVKASNHHGVWSDHERTLKVIILPPPWRTWWSYTGYGLLVLGLLYWARSNIMQRERLKSNLAMARVAQEKEHFELEKAKEVDKVKTSFFTNISHEFRTPLTLIKGPVQSITEQFVNGQKDFDRNKIVEQLKLVQRNSDLLLKLINQLLELAKLESGSLKVEKTEDDVFSFVRAIASSFESFARQKNVFLQVNVPEGNCNALFDKDKVETIFINLINNAIKFTPAGGEVKVITEAHHELITNNQQLTLRVRDTGIGIPKEQQSKIFERFHQVNEAHKEVGTGIGLALAKELVALMGGEISVQSEVGKGSEFKVLLPLELVASSVLRVTSMEQSLIKAQLDKEVTQLETGNSQPGTRNPELATILVVEDNPDLRHFIIDSLGIGFQFLEAENGKQGLEKATSEVPDLIISDVMMPEMDGITMAEKIKKDIRSSHIPLILLTAKSTEDSKLHGLASGADDYLTKPFNKNELLLKVRNGIARQLKLREKLRAELISTAPKVEVLSEDEKFLNSVKEKILERLSDEQLSVESLADDLGMSRVQLYRKISGLTNISVNVLIRKLRLQHASQLLQQNWGPVSQVAYEVGFSNLSYFSKVFKEEFGVLPSEYLVREK
jgi:signal transduction histidine kinase/DNA-binding response OmpR family regulator/ligand-binding sensor domain-containing protein